ncbi:SRPBCC family protein [Saccharothrix longispora]|uniref:SRPBCC family protein n=1 Tax=Saccharothrix longispora TaxID=33920 RepID=UPI0028FD889D|nr:SRPBCC family protein [Saccharothrix longispora]MBY8850156.1 SRPBCC family protein [Saccharothrix sp. MB29]MDU0289060.1 SRPBCC family protein [Saccharothrix longispora]
MGLNHYRFRSTWWLDEPPALVHGVLADLAGYPRWWREVRGGRRVDDDTAELRLRSVLPYELVVVLRRDVDDPAAGVLRAVLSGDMDGTATWRVAPEGGGTRLVYEQEVVVRRRLLRLLAPVARPLLVANHALMMRSGLRGLRARLAGERTS